MAAHLASLERLLARTARRVRVQRGMEAACWALAASATLAAAWILIAPTARWSALVALAVAVLAFVLGASRRVSGSLVSAAIDRVGALEGRVQAAHEFMRLAPARRTPFVEAALRDAAAASTPVSPAQAAPLRRPRATWLSVLACSACLLSSTRSIARAPREQPRAASSETRASSSVPVLRADELAVREEKARELEGRPSAGAELRASLAAYQALLRELRTGTLSQAQALQRALALHTKLAAARHDDDPADAVTLRALAGELTPAAPELARALAAGALGAAARQLRTLAEQLRKEELGGQQRARLSAALAQARERERERAAERARESELTSLLAREPESSEPSLLKRRAEQKRELDALRRKQATRPRRHLEKLSRALARAARARSTAADHDVEDALDEAADALEHYEGEQQDEEASRELERELAQLHELLQQRALSGEPSQRDPEAQARSDGQARREQPGQARGDERARTGEQEPQADQARSRRERQQRFDLAARGRGDDVGDAGSAPQRTLGSGAGTAQLLVLEQRPGRTVTLETPAESGGSEHDARQLEAPTRGGGRYEDRTLEGIGGKGPSRSQVIRSAAQGGFVSAPYHKVYSDYRAHEEAWLERDDVPAGYRFQVRRYFELVRPREPQEGSR